MVKLLDIQVCDHSNLKCIQLGTVAVLLNTSKLTYLTGHQLLIHVHPLSINHSYQDNCPGWYKNQPMGKNTLGKFMTLAASSSDLTYKKLTNHSVRKTMTQRLVDAKFAPNEVKLLN